MTLTEQQFTAEAMAELADFSPNTRLWVYQADAFLTAEQITEIEAQMNRFVSNWAAHGQALRAFTKVFFKRFLLIAVDENQAQATGCSIDKSVHYLQQLSNHLQIDFFNRLKVVAIAADGQLLDFHFSDIKTLIQEGKISSQTLIFNNNIASKAELESQWLQSVETSWLGRHL